MALEVACLEQDLDVLRPLPPLLGFVMKEAQSFQLFTKHSLKGHAVPSVSNLVFRKTAQYLYGAPPPLLTMTRLFCMYVSLNALSLL